MENVGVTWEQIVALANTLDHRGGGSSPRVEDQIRLARLVLDFNRNVVGQRLKSSPPRAVGEDATTVNVSSPGAKVVRPGPGVVACASVGRELALDVEA
jgi:hypothetical protein